MNILKAYSRPDGLYSIETDDPSFHPAGLPYICTEQSGMIPEVEAYLAAHPEALVPEPVPPPPTPEQLLSQEMQQLLAYLASTDWYRLRKIETGAEIPVDVMTSGAAARARISEIRGLLES